MQDARAPKDTAGRLRSPHLPADPPETVVDPLAERHWSEVDWSRYEHREVIAGKPLNYVQLGDPSRPALIFVHGLVGRWQNWLPNLIPFAADHYVIAVDLPGWGESEPPDDGLCVAHYADVLYAFCRDLGIERATFIGNSLGGYVSAVLAKRHPDLVERLVLVAASGISTTAPRFTRLVPFFLRIEKLLSLGYRMRRFLSRYKLSRLLALSLHTIHPIAIGERMAYELISGIGRASYRTVLGFIPTENIVEQPGEIRCPTLIVWGRWDLVVPVADAHEYAWICPDHRVVIFQRAGHIPQIDRPELFNRFLREFLEEDAQRPAESVGTLSTGT